MEGYFGPLVDHREGKTEGRSGSRHIGILEREESE